MDRTTPYPSRLSIAAREIFADRWLDLGMVDLATQRTPESEKIDPEGGHRRLAAGHRPAGLALA